jgi:hypothetical protein
MIKYFLFMHIMVADPNAHIPKTYDFWFDEPELRYYKTEKDCKNKGNEIMEWSRQQMETQNLIVLDTWFECIEVQKNEKASLDNQPRGYKKI